MRCDELDARLTSLTVCICTMDRSKELSRCLESVFAGSARPDDVVVSDDSKVPGPVSAVAARYPVRYFAGPRQGLARNRIQCVDLCRTSHIAFIDDDVVLPSGYFAAALARLSKTDEDVVLTGGEVRHPEGRPPEIVHPRHTDFLGYQRRPTAATLAAIVINSTFFPRSVFTACTFDARMKFGSEEIDIARQAVQAGFRIEHEPTLLVDHYQSPINRADCAVHLDASRLYASIKNYLYFERKPLCAILFAVAAPLHLLAAETKSDGMKGVRRAFRSVIRAGQFLSDYRRSTPQQVRRTTPKT